MRSAEKDYIKEYKFWTEKVKDADTKAELQAMDGKTAEDAFCRELTFGTGGLRGVIGAGTNRMNIYVVAKATQGFANYLKGGTVVIGYDTRIKSELFAKVTAGVLAANGIKVFIWKEPLPVPMVSYAIRKLGACGGVMITASHNQARYNGYKIYDKDGCQITTKTAKLISDEIQNVEIFSPEPMPFDEAISCGAVEYINEAVLSDYIEEIKKQSVLFGDKADKNISVVYSPLNGTGFRPIMQILGESGFSNITVVKEQQNPDGNFPTCPYPNPETREAMALGIEYSKRVNADLLIATDPDCDRCGIAVYDKDGYKLLTGNEVGLLLLEYICSQRKKHGKMPKCPIFIKTIVTTELAEKIAEKYGVKTVNVLTGFKFIGEVIGTLEDTEDYIFGFEESYGYLTGGYVRDKDGVNAAFMICEMLSYYRAQEISLSQKLEEIYKTYGYCIDTQHSYMFEGSAGIKRMKEIMADLRKGIAELGGEKIEKIYDYSKGIDNLPVSDVLKLHTKKAAVTIRPSGTEPKMKIYVSVKAKSRIDAKKEEEKIIAALEKWFK